MTESDARSILEDCDPAVLDNYEPPNLSGEWADSETPASLARDVLGFGIAGLADDRRCDVVDAIAYAWSDAVDAAWSDALQAGALRVVGRIGDTLKVERELEAEADRLREAARS